jgi:hypothetical protein
VAESWESVAHALGARLNHATEPDHNPVRLDCPHCADGLAFQRYAAKRKSVGRPYVDPMAGAVAVRLEDIRPATQMETPRG